MNPGLRANGRKRLAFFAYHQGTGLQIYYYYKYKLKMRKKNLLLFKSCF